MLLSMIRLLARLVERRRGATPVGDDSFFRSLPALGLPARNGARRSALPGSHPVPTLAPTPAALGEDGWPEPFVQSLRQLWAELAQRQIPTVLIQEKEHDDL
jgi:hypothetical protein